MVNQVYTENNFTSKEDNCKVSTSNVIVCLQNLQNWNDVFDNQLYYFEYKDFMEYFISFKLKTTRSQCNDFQ